MGTLKNYESAKLANAARERLIPRGAGFLRYWELEEESVGRSPDQSVGVNTDVTTEITLWTGLPMLRTELQYFADILDALEKNPTGAGDKELLDFFVWEMTNLMVLLEYFRETNGIPLIWTRYNALRKTLDARTPEAKTLSARTSDAN